jgi:hypothetical protein
VTIRLLTSRMTASQALRSPTDFQTPGGLVSWVKRCAQCASDRHPVNGRSASDPARHLACSSIRRRCTRSWPDFGRTTLQNGGRRCKPARTILADQPSDAQVAPPCGTVYGSDGHELSSLVPRPVFFGYLMTNQPPFETRPILTIRLPAQKPFLARNLWGSRIRPPILTSAFMRLARIR